MSRPAVRDEQPFTRHGKQRFRERVKLPLRAIRRMARLALADGARAEELPFATQFKLDTLQRRLDPAGQTEQRVYRGFIFVFAKEDRALVTVYPLDPALTPDENNFRGKNKDYDLPF